MSDRFWSKVDQSPGPAACWLWTAGGDGEYGMFRLSGRTVRAHRLAYELSVGPLAAGVELHHACGQKLCCNPAHLVPLAKADHTRLTKSAITHCPGGHALAGSNLYRYPNGRRSCRACRAAANRAYRLRKKVG